MQFYTLHSTRTLTTALIIGFTHTCYILAYFNMSSSNARTTIESLINKKKDALSAISDYNGPLMDLLEEEVVEGKLFEKFAAQDLLLELTHFSPTKLTGLFLIMKPFIALAASRGPKPKSSWIDHLICYLLWLVLGDDMDVLAALLDMKPNRFEDNIERIRPIVNASLKEKWWESRLRPIPQTGTVVPHAALLYDHHTSEVFRPKARFAESKHYWDGKNKMYGVKNGVGVMAAVPHYCLFVLPHKPASVHDYVDLKDTYKTMLPYLLKLPEEAAQLPLDTQSKFWSVILDKAYIGPDHDTPNFRRITPKKGDLTPLERQINQQISKVRVPVECFFGRLVSLFGVARNVYRWDHAHFDMDFENMCLLANEHIAYNQLSDLDNDFLLKHLSMKANKQAEKEQKRKGQLERASTKRKAKLRNIQQAV